MNTISVNNFFSFAIEITDKYVEKIGWVEDFA